MIPKCSRASPQNKFQYPPLVGLQALKDLKERGCPFPGKGGVRAFVSVLHHGKVLDRPPGPTRLGSKCETSRAVKHSLPHKCVPRNRTDQSEIQIGLQSSFKFCTRMDVSSANGVSAFSPTTITCSISKKTRCTRKSCCLCGKQRFTLF